MKKHSKWFDGKQKPWEPGVYERKMSLGNRFAYFDGDLWSVCANTIGIAMSNRRSKSLMQINRDWRGLASNPNAG
jgi:hypothetical protein